MTSQEPAVHPALSPALISASLGLLAGVMLGIALCSPHWPAAGQVPIGDGVHAVGHDIDAGFYRTDGGPDVCDWQRVSDLTGADRSVLAIDARRGPQTVQVLATDAGLVTGGGCEWIRVA